MSERRVLSECEISTDEAYSRLQEFLRKKSMSRLTSNMEPATLERLRRMAFQMARESERTEMS